MQGPMTEVRVKLHIKLRNDPEVKNLWMCLDYDQKPTISHVIEHVKKNLLDKNVNVLECKLYLDNYWLPNYENSRLIRENDCIKVEVTCEEPVKVPVIEVPVKHATLNQDVLAHIKAHEQRITEKQTQMEGTYRGLSPEEIATVEAATRSTGQYNHYFEPSVGHMEHMMAWNQNIPEYQAAPEVVKSMKKTVKTQQVQQSKSPQKPKEATNCYRKFAIGSYAHMLSEPVQAPVVVSQKKTKKSATNTKKVEEIVESDNVSEEQLIDKYYDVLYNKKASQQNNQNSDEFGKIAANVKATGQQKWKNSTQQTKQNGPKHIKFKSSDSSSSEDEPEEVEPEIVKPSAPKLKINLKKTTEASSKYYEPTKEEQLDAVSYNRSYFIKNTKNLIEFKKTFNEDKLTAPQSEHYAYRPEYNGQASKKKTEFNLNTSASSSASDKYEKKAMTVPKVCYDKFQNMVGAPRVDDKIAFQILEISSNFTPEVSGYKTGVVLEFDEDTNEITLELENTRYNQVLKKASKFSVILDETDQEEMEQILVKERRNSQELAENTMKVDWRNLMNLKLVPTDAEFLKQQEVAVQEQQTLKLHV